MRKKILLVVSSMNTGGAERVASQLVNAWADRGNSVILLATFSGRGGCAYPLDSVVDFRYLADAPGGQGKGALAFARRLRALRRIVREEAPDVVVSFLTSVNVMTLMATAGLNCPTIAAEHSYPPAQPMTGSIAKLRLLTYPMASLVTVLTGEGRDWMHRHIPRARVEVIPNPVVFPLASSPPAIDPADLVGTQRKLLLAAGRHDEGKQFSHLIRAFSMVAEQLPEWDLIVLGDGPSRRPLKLEVESLGLAVRVKLPGRVGNMGEWYARADLFALTSRFEGFPLVLAEAMAYGCPVVSYDCDTGPRDIVRDGIDGLLVAPSAGVDGLAKALSRLMSEEGMRLEMSKRAVEARERFSIGRILEYWDGAFERVTAAN